MAVVYHQTGTVAPCGGIAACSGATLGTTFNPRLASVGGTSGGATTGGGNNWDAGLTRAFWAVEISPGTTGVTWAAGNWTIRLNVTTARACTWTATYICRVNSACASQATIGSLTGQTISLNSTGVKTMTVTGAAQTPTAGDKVYIVFVGSSTIANASLGITSDQDIDSPFVLDRRGQVSWTEFEIPNAPRRGQVSFVEFEVPDAPRRGQVSWAEFEVPAIVTDRRGQVSWAELEVPNEPRRGQVSFTELEIPNEPRRGQLSWIEFETPDAPRRGQVSWAEFETPDAPRRGQISWIEFEVPGTERRGQVSWAEFEVPDAPTTDRFAQLSWIEFEVPDEPRRGQLSWLEFEVPNVPSGDRRGQISWMELEVPSRPPPRFMYARYRGSRLTLEGE